MNLNSIENINCTGCAACYSICNHNAIIMQEDEAGFKYPKILEEKCIDCNMCVDICPALHIKYFDTKNPLYCYAVKGNDAIRYKSSSGGLFTYISDYIIEQGNILGGGGYIAGAAFDDNLYLSHTIVNDKTNLEKLKKSKYIQSDINDTYKEIKKLLKNNNYVFFTGTPCQVAGLKSYLKKEYDNLITADIICHGVPSQKLFHKYLKEEFPNEDVIHYDFRDKSKGWKTAIELIKTRKKEYKREFYKNLFGRAFIENLSLRECCGKCDYTNLNRVGDITLGDFWGINKYNRKINDNKGISVALLNSDKGINIFDNIKDKFQSYMQIPIEYAVEGNIHLKHSSALHPNSKVFRQNIDRLTLSNNITETKKLVDKTISIVNYVFEEENIGAILTSYALETYLKTQYKEYNIYNISYAINGRGQDKNKYFYSFKKNMNIVETNNDFNTFTMFMLSSESIIYGSDQVFRYKMIKHSIPVYLGILTKNKSKLISIAASFGNDDKILRNKKILPIYKLALKRFSCLSVREKTGLKICNSLGFKDVKHILDPVFLLDKDDYKKYEVMGEGYSVFAYRLSENEHELNLDELKSFVSKLNIDNIKIVNASDRDTSIEEWITYILNCDIVITSSYHGAAFAIIFEKEFVFVNGVKGGGRLKSLNELLGIENRIYNTFNEIDIEYIKNNKIDYAEVNKKLNILKQETKEYIKYAMDYRLSENEIKMKEDISKQILKIYKKQYRISFLSRLYNKHRYKFLISHYKKMGYNERSHKYSYYLKMQHLIKNTIKFLEKNQA